MSNINSNDAFNKASIRLEVDNIVSEIKPQGMSFTLYDSLYSFYPKASLSINDYSGTYQEYMAFVNGTKVKISFGNNEEDWKKCSYRVVKNSTPEQKSQNNIGGDLELSLIHDYYNTQSKNSRAFNSNISDIIRTLSRKYSFNSLDIDDTLNSGIWYQPFITDGDFIFNQLLPFAYSTDSDNSPFYCYIDSNNNFNFKNYKKLFLQNPIREFYYKSGGTISSLDRDSILAISFSQVPLSEVQPFYNRIIQHYDEKGNYVREGQNSKLTDFPKNNTEAIPLKANTSAITSIENNLYDDDIILDYNKNNRLGYISNSVGKVLSPDKVVLTVNLDRSLVSGKKVRLNLPSMQDGFSDEISLRNTGDYIIESSYHKWTGTNAITILVCSKQIIKVTKEYRNINLVLNR